MEKTKELLYKLCYFCAVYVIMEPLEKLHADITVTAGFPLILRNIKIKKLLLTIFTVLTYKN